MLVPQPIEGIATLLLDPDGHIPSQDALHHQWFALDIGGGTTDYTGRTGLNVIPGTEGGVRLGIQNAAQLARQLIQHRYPALQHLDTGQVLAQMRQSDPVIYLSGEPLSIQTEIDAAVTQTSHEILAHILPQWERHLAQGEVVLFGGGGAQMAAPIQQVLQDFTRVTLLSDPLFRVLDGIERLARRQLSQKNSSG